MILVTGAKGSVGHEVVNQLHAVDCEVRALSRNTDKAGLPAGVEVVVGDLSKLETLSAALEGVEKVFWVLPLEADFNFPQLAKQMGVKHIVLLSAIAVDFGEENAIARLHMNAEQAVRESGVAWTFLRPGAFMTNAFQWANSIRSEGVVQIPFGDKSSPVVDSRDIAAVAVEALRSEKHEGKIYRLTGPESLSPRQQVKIIDDVLGRSHSLETVPDDIAREHMLKRMPVIIVDALIELNTLGTFTDVLPAVEEVTGRAPRTFKQWATDHIKAFQ